MIDYVEFLRIPGSAALIIICLFFVIQLIGELLEFKGKIVPEFMKIRKYFARKKTERETLQALPQTLQDLKKTTDEFRSHYSEQNLAQRDNWMNLVNQHLIKSDELFKEINLKLDKNNADTLDLLIDNKRNTIISFAERVVDAKSPVTREQFNRIFKMYRDYEKIIEANGLVNGEVDIAYRIIKESYEDHMREHTFVEDVRGYDY